jgi:ornithine cyclodeaminase/alanine dehydrogenase-like protein (mu-crystallin family)
VSGPCARSAWPAAIASNARAFVRREAARYSFPVEAASGVEEAVRNADLIVTATSSAVPVLRREWVKAAAHLLALRESAIRERHIRAELGELLIRRHAGRTGNDEITLFKSMGLAVEDLAAAWLAYRRARETGAGHQIDS